MAASRGHRTWTLNPNEYATITLRVEGDWMLTGPDGNYLKEKGEYKLYFTPKSPTSLSMVIIDPDPGGGTPT